MRWHLISQLPPPPLHLSYNLHHKLICIWYNESYLCQSVHLKLKLCTTWCLNLDGFKLRGFDCHSDGLPQQLCAIHCSPSFIPKLNYSGAMTSTTKIALNTVSSVHKCFSTSKPADSVIQDTIALWTILQMLSLIEKADLDLRKPANIFNPDRWNPNLGVKGLVCTSSCPHQGTWDCCSSRKTW